MPAADDRSAADAPDLRPRPGRAAPQPADASPYRRAQTEPAAAHAGPPARRRRRGLPQPPPAGELVTTTAGVVVSAARVGRLLGRTGLRLARQLPGVSAVESQAQRLGQVAASEMLRMLELPQQFVTTATPEERRVMMLVQDSGTDPEPLRSAMSELLQRSSASDTEQGRGYLFGTIISQLVPDEARILAALAGGRRFAAVDVLAKQVGRSQARTVIANASTIGATARVTLLENVPTYLSRLHSFGLVDFGPVIDGLDSQFAALHDDPMVRAARHEADSKFGSAKVVRKSLTLSPLGREFWAASAPSRREIDRLSG